MVRQGEAGSMERLEPSIRRRRTRSRRLRSTDHAVSELRYIESARCRALLRVRREVSLG